MVLLVKIKNENIFVEGKVLKSNELLSSTHFVMSEECGRVLRITIRKIAK